MKLFVDSANLTEIEASLSRGFASGVTTNPPILAKEEKRDYREIVRDIINLITKFGAPLPLSVEVFTMDPDEMIRQAEELVSHFGDYKGLTIKVPIGWDELRLITRLTDMKIPVNATCCMSFNQAVMAVDAGERRVLKPLLRPHPRHRVRRCQGRDGRAGLHGPVGQRRRDHRRIHPPHHGHQRGDPGGRRT